MTHLDNQIKFFDMIFKISFQWKKVNAFVKLNSFSIFSSLKSIIKYNRKGEVPLKTNLGILIEVA